MIRESLCVVLATSIFQLELGAQNTQSAPSAQTTRPASPGDIESSQVTDEYIIGPEDVLMINVWMEPEITSRVVVRPDGKIGLSLLNEVEASGLTPRQLQERITQGLREFVSGPTVSVIVQEIRSNRVFITGAVGRSGEYVLGAPTNVMQLLVRAGGLTEFAKSEEITIVRVEGNRTRRLRFNYKQFIEGRDFQQNIQLQRGDMIIVP
jgi:polysaccharide biosynthesis/export protein